MAQTEVKATQKVGTSNTESPREYVTYLAEWVPGSGWRYETAFDTWEDTYGCASTDAEDAVLDIYQHELEDDDAWEALYNSGKDYRVRICKVVGKDDYGCPIEEEVSSAWAIETIEKHRGKPKDKFKVRETDNWRNAQEYC